MWLVGNCSKLCDEALDPVELANNSNADAVIGGTIVQGDESGLSLEASIYIVELDDDFNLIRRSGAEDDYFIQKAALLDRVEEVLDGILTPEGQWRPEPLNLYVGADDEEEVLKRGVPLYDDGDLGPAVLKFQSVLDRFDNNPVALYYLGQIQIEQGRIVAGIAYLERAIEADSNHFDARVKLAGAYLRNGDSNKARDEYEGVVAAIDGGVQVPKQAAFAAWIGLGDMRLIENDTAGALVAYEQALELDSQNQKLLLGIGAVYAANDQFDLALRRYERAISIYPDNETARRNTMFFLIEKSEGEIRQSKYKEAVGSLLRAEEIAPSKERVKRLIADALRRKGGDETERGWYAEAINSFTKEIEYVVSARANKDLGLAHFWHSGIQNEDYEVVKKELQKAINQFQNALKLLGIQRDRLETFEFASLDLIDIYIMSGEYDAAIHQAKIFLGKEGTATKFRLLAQFLTVAALMLSDTSYEELLATFRTDVESERLNGTLLGQRWDYSDLAFYVENVVGLKVINGKILSISTLSSRLANNFV